MQPSLGPDQVLYLYGVIPKGQRFSIDVDLPLQAVSHATVTAVVEPVCSVEFSPETLDERL